MTPPLGTPTLTVAVSYTTGFVVICAVVAAIAVLVCVLWRRSTGGRGMTSAVSAGPRTDSHAVSALLVGNDPAPTPAPGPAPDVAVGFADTAAAVPSQAAPTRSSGAPPVVAPAHPERSDARRAPHPSGLGAAELAAIVEDGLASLRSDVDTLGDIIDAVGSASAVPEDLPARPASQQVALVDQMAAMIASDLERAHRLAETVALDVDRGHRARAEVHGELDRIGLPVGFFVAMDSTAADLAVDLVRAQMSVERLVRRFESLSSLYSSVRPTVDLLADLGAALRRAVAVADPWRRSPGDVDLVQRTQAPQPLPG
ncbi:MAG: hypothetical protein ACE367_12600 [Acidimicrobiales bacterium]